MHEQVTRRRAVSTMGAAAAGALALPTLATARPSLAMGVLPQALPFPDLPNAVKTARLAAVDFRAPDSTTAWQLTAGALRTTAASARFAASLSPAPGDQLTEVTLFIDPGGQTGSVKLTRESFSGNTDLMSGVYGPSTGATTVHLFVPGQPVYADPAGYSYTLGVDLKPGVTLYGATVTYFSQTTDFVFIDPVRVWDSRTLDGSMLFPGARAGGRKSTGTEFGFTVDTVIPRFSYGPLLNVTLTQTAGSGYAVVYGKGELDPAPPPISNINWYGSNQTVANLVVTKMVGEADITVGFGGSGSTHVIIDVLGYLT